MTRPDDLIALFDIFTALLGWVAIIVVAGLFVWNTFREQQR
jgi:hypothetical protein